MPNEQPDRRTEGIRRPRYVSLKRRDRPDPPPIPARDGRMCVAESDNPYWCMTHGRPLWQGHAFCERGRPR